VSAHASADGVHERIPRCACRTASSFTPESHARAFDASGRFVSALRPRRRARRSRR
jgi:hypothetical protein